jgi:hypothetical protein
VNENEFDRVSDVDRLVRVLGRHEDHQREVPRVLCIVLEPIDRREGRLAKHRLGRSTSMTNCNCDRKRPSIAPGSGFEASIGGRRAVTTASVSSDRAQSRATGPAARTLEAGAR